MENKFDPRTILLSTIILIIALIFMNDFITVAISASGVFIQLSTFGYEKENIFRLLKFSLGLFISIIFINYFFMNKTIVEISLSLFRLIGIILLAASLLSSINIIDIGFSIEKLLSPLKIFKIPVETIGTITALALKFIPLLQEEAIRIQTAQKARGIDYDLMSIKEKIKNIPTLFLPVIISAIQHSVSLASAMEVRGYGAPVIRTRLYNSHLKKQDYLYLSGTIFILLIILFLVYNI
jgi:energy-coupling factor transport system permease protein